ncbi:MAG: acyltransferase [Betaproteobacteria bacterium]|nr:acyltransferase [Betaproteobacteria bacterium]
METFAKRTQECQSEPEASAVSPSSSNPAIEALRGLGALMVMIAHYRAALGLSDPFTGSFWLGVDLFFVVSGYVFGRHLDEGVGPLPAYALRRLARILPLYWVVLVLYASASPLGFTAFVPHALMLHTAGSLALAQSYNAAFWSLPVELCFYGTVPLLAALMQKRSKRLVLGLALAVGVGLQALISWQALAGWPSLAADAANHAPDANRWLWLHFQLPGRWLEFVFGFLAYAWVKRQQGVAPGASRCLVMGLKLRFVLGFALGLTAALGCLAWAARIAQVPESAWKMLWLMQLPWLFALCVMPVVAALAYWAQMSFWRGARTKRTGFICYTTCLPCGCPGPVCGCMRGSVSRWPGCFTGWLKHLHYLGRAAKGPGVTSPPPTIAKDPEQSLGHAKRKAHAIAHDTRAHADRRLAQTQSSA